MYDLFTLFIPQHKMKILLFVFTIIIPCISSIVNAQTTTPQAIHFTRLYSPKEYQAGDINTAVRKDKNGILYFANALGVIQFDGRNWRTIKIPNTDFIRTLDIDENGTVFIGTINQMGKLEPDSTGKLMFVSLLNLLNKEDRNFGEIWQVKTTPQGVFFCTDKYIFRYKNNKIKKWKTDGKYFYLVYYVENKVYVLDKGAGLKKLEGEELKLIFKEEWIKKNNIFFMLPYPKTQKGEVIVAKQHAVFSIYNPQKNEFRDFETELTEEEMNSICHGVIGSDGNYYISTLRHGIICMNQEGKKIFQYKQTEGITNKVYAAELDNQNNLWLALGKGIAKIETASPFLQHGEKQGITGVVTHAKNQNGLLYVSSTNGVFYYNTHENRFSIIKGKAFQTWKMQTFPVFEDTLFLAITNTGINQIKDTFWTEYVNTTTSVNYIIPSSITPNRLYVGIINQKGVYQLDILKNGKKNFVQVVPDITTSGLVMKDNLLFVLDDAGKVHLFEEKDFLEDKKINSDLNIKNIEIHNNDVFVVTHQAIYTWKDAKFQPHTTINTLQKKGNIFSKIFNINDSNIVIRCIKEDEVKHYLFNTKTNMSKQLPTARLTENFISIESFFEVKQKNKIGLGTSEGVFYLDLTNSNYQKSEFNVFIRKVVQADSVIFDERYTSKNKNLIFSYQQNSFTFFYSSNNSLDEQNTLFRHKLNGYDKKWSEWTTETKKEYTNLDKGKYSFEVEAKNIYGKKSQIERYTFKIKPPFYKTVVAYVCYIILLIVLVWTIIKLNLKRLKNINIRLEKIVAKRTAELEEINNEIVTQNHSITLKNKNIKSSINYASRIQKAMLPPIEEIQNAFNEAFVLWLPCNVVSGDFYWFAKIENKIFVAAVDCTGHGVPGAFMSMIGNDMLNHIVVENKITTPSLILSNLHQKVSTALRQSETKNQDGMDISLCFYDTQTKELEFAGAKNRLYYVQNGKLKDIAGNKFPIGGKWGTEKERVYQNHTLKIDQPTTIFLCTDGYQDQFGGENGRKMMKKRMKSLFTEIADLEDIKQKEKLENYFLDWKKNEEQVDDVLIMGFKIG